MLPVTESQAMGDIDMITKSAHTQLKSVKEEIKEHGKQLSVGERQAIETQKRVMPQMNQRS